MPTETNNLFNEIVSQQPKPQVGNNTAPAPASTNAISELFTQGDIVEVGRSKDINTNINPNLYNAIRPIEFKDIYAYAGPSEGFIRKYPLYLPGQDNKAFNAARQSGWEYWGNAAKSFGVLTVNSFFNQAASTLSNIGKLSSGNFKNFFDSDVAEFSAEVASSTQYKYPIYSTANMQQYEENNKGLLGTLGKYVPFGPSGNSGRYWARLAGQLGFTAGTIGYAIAEEAALLYTTGGIGSITAAPRNLYKVFRSVGQVFNNADRLVDAYKTNQAFKSLGNAGLYTLRMANLSTGEARLEALMAKQSFMQNQIKILEDKGITPTLQDLENIDIQSEKVANTVFNWNMPVLLLSNLITIPNLIKPRSLSAGKLASAGAKTLVDGTKWSTKKELTKGVFKKYGKDTGSFIGKLSIQTLPEGFEELAQGIGSRTAEQYYSLDKSDIGKSNEGFIQTLGNEISKSFQTGEGWDEFVSGWLTGSPFGTYRGITDIRRDNVQSKELADAFNSSFTQLKQSINYKNLNEQTVMATEASVSQSNGNTKRVKDIRNEAITSFFQVARRSGKDKEAITELVQIVDAMQKDNPESVADLLQDKTLDEYQKELNSQYDLFTKYSDMAETLFDKELRAGSELDQTIMENIKNQYVGYLMGSADARSRITNITNDIRNLTQNSKNSSKINELTSTLFDEDSLNESISSLSSLIDSTKQYLENVQVTPQERSAKNKELKENQKQLEILESIQQGLYGKEYSPEKVVKLVTDSIVKYDPTVNRDELNNLVNDMVELETENQQLVFVANMLHNEKFREKYYGAVKDAYEKNLNKQNSQVQQPLDTTTPTQEESQNTTLTVDEANSQIANSELNPTTVEDIVNSLRGIVQTPNGFEYNGQQYGTYKEAADAIYDSLFGQTRDNAIANRDALETLAKGQTTPTTENITEEDYQNFQDNPDQPIPQETLDRLDQIKNPTEQEQEMIDAAKEQKKQQSIQQANEGIKKPKTIEDVRKAPSGYNLGSDKGILTNFYQSAVGRIYPTVTGALKHLETKKLREALKGITGITISTVNLNDNLIKEDVIDETKITQETIQQNLDTKGYTVVKDIRNRLIVISKGDQEQARQNLLNNMNLYLGKSAKDRMSEVRLGGPKGQVLPSTFDQENFTVDNIRAVNSIRKGDKVTVVIPANQFNKDLVEKFNKVESVNEEELQSAFKNLKDNLVLELRKDGLVVGVMKAGDYFGTNKKMTDKIGKFRSDVVTPEILGSVGNVDVTTGTVKVSQVVPTFKINEDDNGKIFTTLQDYENSHKANKNIQVKYFIAKDTETLVDKNGKELSRTQIGRTSFFAPNAIYVQVKNTDTNETVVTQGVAEQPLTFTEQDLQGSNFKTQLSINLRPSESPLISTRIAVDENSFSQEESETTNKSDLKSEILTALDGGNKLTLNIGNFILPLTEVNVDYDLGMVQGKDPNGNTEVVSFINITSVSEYVEAPKPKGSIAQSEVDENVVLEISNIANTDENYNNWSNVRDGSDRGQFISLIRGSIRTLLKSPKSATKEDINDYLLTQKHLKLKEIREQVTEAIFNNLQQPQEDVQVLETQETETKDLIAETTSEVEILEQPIEPTQETEEWILDSGELGKVYTLEDGTAIVVLERNDNGTKIAKDNFLIRIDKDGNEEKLDVSKFEEEAKNILDENLYEIWKNQNNGLSLRDETILLLNKDRIEGFVQNVQQIQDKFTNGYDQYVPNGLKDMLSTLGILPNEFLLQLAMTNFDLTQRGVKVETLQQLMTEAKVPEAYIEAIQETLSFGAYISLYKLSTEGLTAKVSQRKVQEGKQLMLDFGDDTVLDAINVETSQQEEQKTSAFGKLVNGFKKLLGKQGLIINGFENFKNFTTNEINEATKAIKDLVLSTQGNLPADAFIRDFVTLNQALRPYGVEVNLENLVKVEPSDDLSVGVKFVQINDNKNFLKEFDDKQMNEENRKRLQDNKDTIFIKRDEGGLFELPVRSISNVMNENERNDKVFLEDILAPLGYSLDDIFIIANNTVNGNATSLIERSLRKVKEQMEPIYDTYNIRPQNGVAQETYFNKDKAEKSVKEKTCN